MEAIKRLLEALGLVRLVWFTHPWKKAVPDIKLRIVRYQGPRREPWCWSAGGWRALLLPNGKCKGRYNGSWEPYNNRSPYQGQSSAEANTRFEDEPPRPSSWAN